MDSQQLGQLGWDKSSRLILFVGKDTDTKVDAILAANQYLNKHNIKTKILFLPLTKNAIENEIGLDKAAKDSALNEYADSELTLLVNTQSQDELKTPCDAFVHIDPININQAQNVLNISSELNLDQLAKLIGNFLESIWKFQPKQRQKTSDTKHQLAKKQLLQSLRDSHNSLYIEHNDEVFINSLNAVKAVPDQPIYLNDDISSEHQSLIRGTLRDCLKNLNILLNQTTNLRQINELVGLLPLATMTEYTQELDPSQTHKHNQKVADFIVQLPFAETTIESIRIIAASPLNELGVLPYALYELSDTGIHEVLDSVDSLPYSQKQSLYSELLERHPKEIMHHTYELEVILPIYDLIGLQQTLKKSNLIIQPLSPRLGYVVPEVLSQLPSSDLIENSYDDVLSLYSKLSTEYTPHALEQLLLCGFKGRARIVISSFDLLELLNQNEFERPWLKPLLDQLVLKHPIVFSNLLDKEKPQQ